MLYKGIRPGGRERGREGDNWTSRTFLMIDLERASFFSSSSAVISFFVAAASLLAMAFEAAVELLALAPPDMLPAFEFESDEDAACEAPSCAEVEAEELSLSSSFDKASCTLCRS